MKKIIITFIILLCGTLALAQKPTRQEFLAVCDSLGVKHPNVVWAQARLESGNFGSTTYMKKHNCLGIYDSKRKQYASFKNWQDCIKAYRDRVQYRFKRTDATDEEYLYWLSQIGYSREKTYTSKVRQIMWEGK